MIDGLRQSPAPSRAWPVWPLQVVLLVLFLGPVVAPLFQATELWLVADSGVLARDLLSRYVCPTPLKSYSVLGFPMAVCARCWGATVGLWIGWLALRWTEDKNREPRGANGQLPAASCSTSSVSRLLVMRFLALPWTVRLALAALPFLLWALEIRYWPGAPLGVLLANGAFAGCWAGLFFYSPWPGLHNSRNV